MADDSHEQIEQWMDEGIALLNADRFTEAREIFSRVLGHRPAHVEALYYRGVVQGHLGEVDAAIADFSAAIAADPGDADLRAARGEAWEEQHEQRRALIDFEAALELDPENPDFRHRVQQLRQLRSRR
jgi:tetratricopeptide (TPR) repeat protein